MKQFYDINYFNNRKEAEAKRHKVVAMTKRILRLSPGSVLDVGCGHGFLVKHLQKTGMRVTGCDWMEHAGSEIPGSFVQAEAIKLPFEDQSFDVVVSVDFMEHLPEEDIDKVYAEMCRVGDRVIAQIGFKPDRLRKGETVDTHLTVRPKEWWIKKLPGCIIY